VDVLIRLERMEPPAGTVVPRCDQGLSVAAPLPFVGWLGLIRVLAEVVRAETEPPGSARSL
jgi:hypothetical protein